MKTIFLLSRGGRLSSLFQETARELSKRFRVVVTVGFNDSEESDRICKEYESQSDVIAINLPKEIEKRGKKSSKKVHEVEAELGLTLFKSASNYLLYRRFSKDYYKHWHGLYSTEEEIRVQFLGSYEYFAELFEQYDPAIIFCETIDVIPHRVAAVMAQKRNRFLLANSFATSLGKGRAFLGSGSNLRNVLLEYFFSHSESISTASWEEAGRLLENYGEKGVLDTPYLASHKKQAKGILNKERLRKIQNLSRKTVFQTFRKESSRLWNLLWLEKYFKTELPNEPYILFSLHHQPEANTKLVAPRWVDQDRTIEQLAINAPAGMKIVVKENPQTYGLRGKSYFGFMTDFPNIHLLHPSFDNTLAIRRAEAVLSISGTVGVEALFMGKKVGILSSTYYSFYPGIRQLRYPEEIFEYLKKSWPFQEEEVLKKFAAAFVESSFVSGVSSATSPFPAEVEKGGQNYAAAIEKFLSRVEQFGLIPTAFPLEV